MKESVFNRIYKNIKPWIYFSIVFLIALYISFYKENFSNIIRIFFAFLVLGIIPGCILSKLFFESLDTLTKMILGFCLSFCIVGIFGYYLGLMGLHLKYFVYVYYAVMLLGLFISKKSGFVKNQQDKTNQDSQPK